MNYFRAMLHNNERSERSLGVTTEAILLNPANYTAWYFRRLILEAIGADYNKELDFVAKMALDQPKNYQIWHHRHVIVDVLQDPSKEMAFTEDALSEDAKNYHCWSHRQWVISKFNLWDGELNFCDKLISEDIRNNSAWNQRYFVVKHLGLTDERILEELTYTITKISRAPNNESAWNYLLGLTRKKKLSHFPIIEDFCNEKKSQWVACSHVLATLVDCLEENGTKERLSTAIEYCDKLVTSLDDVHKKYWIWRKTQIEKQLHSIIQ